MSNEEDRVSVAPPGQRTLQVLVIDDEPLVCSSLTYSLRKLGHAVASAPNGRKGLALHMEQPADVVVCDVFMPEQDGIETLRMLRAHDRRVGIVVISGGSSIGPARDFLRAAHLLGADATLAKPFTTAELADALDRAVQRQSAA